MKNYINEVNKLKGLMSEEVYNLLKDNKAIIAGGTITSLFTNQEVNDLDIYLPSQRAVVNVLASAMGEECYTENEVVGINSLFFSNMTDKSMLFVDVQQKTPIQLITFQYFDKPEEIFETFDFTCCMGAFVLETEEFVLHEDFLKHCSQRYLKYNPNTAFPIISALRVDKYKQKGYSISKSEFIRIVLSCMDLEINGWDDFKSHIGGMYGYDMDKLFDEEKGFSLMEAIEQMSHIISDHKYEHSHCNLPFKEALEKFDPAEEIDIPEPPYKEGYYYKHVTNDLMSPMCGTGNRIKYEIGSIVNGGNYGIYVHADPLKPYMNSGVCIELEPLMDAKEKPCTTGGYFTLTGYSGQKQILGNLKVTRIVPHFDGYMSKSMVKYWVE